MKPRSRLASSLVTLLLLTPAVQATIWWDGGAGSADFGTAANCPNDALPSSGQGNAFIGPVGGPGGTSYGATFAGTMTTSAELQVGAEANAYGNGSGTYNLSGGVLNANGDFTIDESSSGTSTFNQTGRPANLNGGGNVIGRSGLNGGSGTRKFCSLRHPDLCPIFGGYSGNPLIRFGSGQNARATDRGRNGAFAPLPPPNRTGGSPASGSPVSVLLHYGDWSLPILGRPAGKRARVS